MYPTEPTNGWNAKFEPGSGASDSVLHLKDLTLTNSIAEISPSISSTVRYGIFASSDQPENGIKLTVRLEGENTVSTADGAAVSNVAISVPAGASTLKFTGGGKLQATAGSSASAAYGLYAAGSVTVSDGCVVSCTGGEAPRSVGAAGRSLTVTDSTLTASGNTGALNQAPRLGTSPNDRWYMWKSNTTTTEPTGGFTQSSVTPYAYSGTHKYLKVTPAYGISLLPDSYHFGAVTVGYTRPAPHTFAVKNTGNMPISLHAFNDPHSTVFEVCAIGDWSTALRPGETRDILTVQPKEGLPIGTNTFYLSVAATIPPIDTATATSVVNFDVVAPVPPAPPAPSGGGSSISGGGADTGNQYPGAWNNGALTVQAPCEKCVSVSVDNVQLKENADYTKDCGSTIVTLTPRFLATLKDGAHTIRVQFTDGRYDGSFTTPFTASVAAAPMADVPATGDAPLWARILNKLG